MKNRKLLTLLGSICLVLALTALLLPACAKEEAPVTPTPARPTPVAPTPVAPIPAPGEWELPEVIGFSVDGLGGSQHIFASSITPVMEKCLGTKVRVIPNEGTQVQMGQVRKGIADFWIETSASMFVAIAGDLAFATEDWGPQPLRTIWKVWPMDFGICVLGDSPIEKLTGEEIKGKRIPDIIVYPAYGRGVRAVIEQYCGLNSDEDMVIVPFGGFKAANLSIVEGKADLLWTSTSTSVAFQLEANPHGLRWLPMDDKEAMERYAAANPPHTSRVCQTGVSSARGIPMSGQDVALYCYPDADEELIYQIARFFGENFDKYKYGTNCGYCSLEHMKGFLQTYMYPMSKGSIRYLKEKGLWTSELDKWNEELLKLEDRYAEAWKSATTEAKAKGMKVDYRNEEWMELWESYLDKLPKFKAGYGRS